MAQYAKRKKECDFYLRGTCVHGENCSFSHLQKQIIEITYDDRNKGYLIGTFLNNKTSEVYIPGFKMNEFYSKNESIILDDHTNKIYEITLHPGGIHYTHQRYLVSTVIKRIENPVNSEINISYRTSETNETEQRFKNISEQMINTNSLIKSLENRVYSKKIIDKRLNQVEQLKIDIEKINEKYSKNISELKEEIKFLKEVIVQKDSQKQPIEEKEEPLRRSKRLRR